MNNIHKVNRGEHHILVCEDNLLNCEILEMLLAEKLFIVDKAQNGAEAVKRFQESAIGYYDLILMDILMPVMDGITATKLIRGLERQDAAQVVIVAMTANAFSEDVQMSLKAGMNAHLSKPIVVQTLMETVEKYLKRG